MTQVSGMGPRPLALDTVLPLSSYGKVGATGRDMF
jgi:hypothetical protein